MGEMNAANPGVRIILAGTTVHNAESFLEELSQLSVGGRATAPSSATGGLSASGLASGLANLAPPNVDRKRIAALTSSVTSSVSSTVQAGVSQAMSKLQ